MPISHKYKFIYSHITKCGGQSITTELMDRCYGGDHKRWPIRDIHLGEIHRKMADYKVWLEGNRVRLEKRGYKVDSYDDYFKFSFVRNPWDRLVSNYFYRYKKKNRKLWGMTKQSGKACDFNTWIKNILTPGSKFRGVSHGLSIADYHIKSQLSWLTDDSENIIVDFIGKLEFFQEDFNYVCDRIKIPHEKIGHINKSEHKHYTEYYNAESEDLVRAACKRDIEYFGYNFENNNIPKSARPGDKKESRLAPGRRPKPRRQVGYRRFSRRK